MPCSTAMDLPAPHDPLDPAPRATAAILAGAYREALLAGSVREAELVIREAIDAGLPETVIGGDIIAPAMRHVGDLWEAGELTVADEHLASEVSARVVTLQREHFRVVRRRGGRRILLTAVEGERHVLGLEMAASVLLHAGFEVRLLGADLPLEELEGAIERHRPDVVGLTAGTSESALLIPVAVDLVREVRPGVGLIVGGRLAGELRPGRPGTAVCRHVADAVELVDGLAQHADLN